MTRFVEATSTVPWEPPATADRTRFRGTQFDGYFRDVSTFPLAPAQAAFEAAAVAFVPELAEAPPPVWKRLEDTVASALADRPATMVRQLVLFVRLLDLAAQLRYGGRLAAIDAPKRARLLHALERAPLLALRRGVWGLRSLVFMGYYTQPEIAAAIGYRADSRGWDARR